MENGHETWDVECLKMDLGEVGWGGVGWIILAQDRDRYFECFNERSGSIKCWETIERLHNWCSAP
jgi:hypothetical protein